jgi:hypothetical protein
MTSRSFASKMKIIASELTRLGICFSVPALKKLNGLFSKKVSGRNETIAGAMAMLVTLGDRRS